MDCAIQKASLLKKKKYGEICNIACLVVKLGVCLVNFSLVIKGYLMRSSLVLKSRPNPPTGFLLAFKCIARVFLRNRVAEKRVSLLADGRKPCEGSVDLIWAGVRNG